MEQIYKHYLQEPEQVEPAWRWFFQGMNFASSGGLQKSDSIKKELGIFQLVYAYREHGALKARLDPLELNNTNNFPRMEDFHLKQEDLSKKFGSIEHLFGKSLTLGEVLSFLEKTYCGTLALQVGGCPPEIQTWFFKEFEKEKWNLNPHEKRDAFGQLAQAQYLENFLHFRFMGQKRFSLEGLDVLIPMMEHLLNKGTLLEMKEMAVGMAHRGRINMLAHFMRQDLRLIFSQFEENLKNNLFTEEDFTGDVKYHMGFSTKRDTPNGPCQLHLGYNPSHLGGHQSCHLRYHKSSAEKTWRYKEEKSRAACPHSRRCRFLWPRVCKPKPFKCPVLKAIQWEALCILF